MAEWRKIRFKVKFYGLTDDKIKKLEDIISKFFFVEKADVYSKADVLIAEYNSILEIIDEHKKREEGDYPPVVLISDSEVTQDDIIKLADIIGDIIKDILSFDDIERLPLVIRREISQRKSDKLKNFHIMRLQTHDIVSDFPTRITFLYEVENALKDAKSKFAMFVIRINSLDIINSALGKDLSDKIVDLVAEEIKKFSHQYDIVGRTSFKDFAILRKLRDEDYEKEALDFAKTLMNNLKKNINYEGLTIKVSPSLGISFFPYDSSDPSELLSFAERASEHPQKITKFSEFLKKDIIEERNVISGIGNALLKKEFFIVYQPIFKIKNMKPEMFEALMRWKGRKVNPEKIISVAEKIGLIEEVSEYIFENVFETGKKIKKYNFAINISPQHLTIPEIIDIIKEKTNKFGIEPQRIYLEISEKSIYEDIIRARKAIENLREDGFNFSIDDFGSGQSTFSILSQIPFEILKIDKKTTENIKIHSDELSDLLIKSVIDIAHTRDKRVVAEGIEREEELDKVKYLGFDMAQGFLLSSPLDESEILKLFI